MTLVIHEKDFYEEESLEELRLALKKTKIQLQKKTIENKKEDRRLPLVSVPDGVNAGGCV